MLCGDLNGKDIQGNGIKVHVWLSHFTVQQKQTHCKAIILQFQKKKCTPVFIAARFKIAKTRKQAKLL